MKNTNISDLLERYEGTPLSEDKLTLYQNWALEFFHDKRMITDPIVDISLNLDITEAKENYKKNFKFRGCSTLTSFLIFKIIETLKNHEVFN
jgi:chloramphenicol O-acetyltransferase type A